MANELPQRLAAILAADIAGYTRLMELDEAGVVAAWRRARAEVIDPTIARYYGRIVKLTGDGFLAEFATLEGAVKAALAMQDAFTKLFSDLPTERAVAFRMGVNIGDIWVDAEDIYGAGVNIAARLEGLAAPGGICISGSAYDAVKHKVPARYESMGRRTLKNVAQPIDVWRVRGAESPESPSVSQAARNTPRRGPTLWWTATGVAVVSALVVAANYAFNDTETQTNPTASAAQVPERSVAVLPFADLSPDADQGWLADGLTEETSNSLTQLRELRVAGRTSSFQFKGAERNFGEIAEMLRVANVVDGSVRRSGTDLRVTARLIRAADGYQIWSDTYNRTTDDLFDVQRDIAEQIAKALDVVLDESRREAMFRSGTSNVEAFEAYRRGTDLFQAVHRFESDQSLWAANDYFERALALDPDYAVAAMGLVDAFVHQLTDGPQGYVANSPYTQEEALAELHKNLDLAFEKGSNPGMKLAADLTREFFGPTWYRMPALIDQLREEWSSNPNSISIEDAIYLSPILLFTKHYDLLRAMAERQVTLDPLSPTSWSARADVELFAGDPVRAMAIVNEARRVIGDNPGLRSVEFRTLPRDEAIRRLRAGPNSENNPLLAALTGDRDKALRLLTDEESRASSPTVARVPLYYLIGATDRIRELVKQTDALPAGSVALVSLMGRTANRLTFDLEDTPNFLARIRQAGLDPASYPGVPPDVP
jgi:class 3 adenylate cyclase/TolB-like protein